MTTTVPPTNERRKASLSARIRSRESAFSAVIFNLEKFAKGRARTGPDRWSEVADQLSIVLNAFGMKAWGWIGMRRLARGHPQRYNITYTLMCQVAYRRSARTQIH